ncbi:MAG: metal-dependent hydrolase [Acidobacteriota bacterium]
MDTITHGITGSLVAKAFLSERHGRIATMAVTLGAVFPDSDTFARIFYSNELAWLENHRGLTHSLLALPVFALLLGVLSCLLARQRKWLLLTCFYGIGIASHIVMDLITSYGTMIWTPASNARAAWDMTFILDFVFTTVVLLPQLTAWVYSERPRAWRRGLEVWLFLSLAGVGVAQFAAAMRVPFSVWTVPAASMLIGVLLVMPSLQGRGFRWCRSRYCRVGAAGVAVYLGLCWVAHQTALARVEEFAKRPPIDNQRMGVQRLAALPAPPSLFQWAGFVETPQGIYRGTIDLAVSAEPAYRFYPHAESNRYLQAAEALEEVKTYRWFARFPWVTYRQEGETHVIEYRDLQFLRSSQPDNSPFTFRVSLDNEGRVLQSGLLNP